MACIYQNEKFSVLIPDGESSLALSVLQCLAKDKNVKKYVLANNRWSPSRFSRYSGKFIYCNNRLGDDEKVDFIFETVKQFRIDVILPVDCKMIALISQNMHILSEMTNVAILQESKLKAISGKWLLGEWTIDNGICCPDNILVSNNSNFDRKLSGFNFRVLAKTT